MRPGVPTSDRSYLLIDLEINFKTVEKIEVSNPSGGPAIVGKWQNGQKSKSAALMMKTESEAVLRFRHIR